MDVSNISPSLSKFPSCTGAFSCCKTARQGYDLCLRKGGEKKSTTNQPCYEQRQYIMELHFKRRGDVSTPFTLVCGSRLCLCLPPVWSVMGLCHRWVGEAFSALETGLVFGWKSSLWRWGCHLCTRESAPGSRTHLEENTRDALKGAAACSSNTIFPTCFSFSVFLA